jgi:hypothetical protein
VLLLVVAPLPPTPADEDCVGSDDTLQAAAVRAPNNATEPHLMPRFVRDIRIVDEKKAVLSKCNADSTTRQSRHDHVRPEQEASSADVGARRIVISIGVR